jgi:hypothetical protein
MPIPPKQTLRALESAFNFFATLPADPLQKALNAIDDYDVETVLATWQTSIEQAAGSLDATAVDNLMNVRFALFSRLMKNLEADWTEPIGVHYLKVISLGGKQAFDLLLNRNIFPLEFTNGNFDDLIRHELMTAEDLLGFSTVFFEHHFESEWEDLKPLIQNHFGISDDDE